MQVAKDLLCTLCNTIYITTTPVIQVGLYRFATAFPGHRTHVALQRQPCASAWPCRHTPFRGFRGWQNLREARSIKTPLWAFTALPLPSQVTAHTLPCSGSPLPAPGHVAILHLEGFKTCAKHGPSRHKTRLWAFTALPLLSQVTANTLPCSGNPLPAPGHVAILHVEGFKTCTKHSPSPHKIRLWAFTALPLPSQVTANTLPCSGSPFPAPGHVAILHVEGFKTCAKHRPSRHKTRLWAFTALPLPSQVTAHTLPCSGSPVPVPGHVAKIHVPPCHCFPRSPRTRCPAAAALCQRLATLPYRHTPLHPFRGFHNLREARAIRTQNPRVGLYRFATAFPGHRTHVPLQRQPFASAWPCRHTPFRGFQNVREARPITTQNPSVGLYRFATAFPGHRTHVALQRQPFASAWPCRHTPFIEGFKTCAKHGPSRHKTRLWAFTALPLLSQVTANTLPCSGSPLPAPGHVTILHLEGFKTCAKHGPSRHKTRLWAFTALPLPSQVTAHTLPCSGSPVPVPGHVAIIHLPPWHCFPRSPRTRCPAAAALCQRLAMSPYSILEGVKTCVKHGPSGHKTPLWAFTALPLLSQVTANTLPCSASPVPAPGHVAILHLEGFKTRAKHGPSRHKTRLWAFTALPLPSHVTAHTLPCSGSPLPAPGHVAILHL